MLIPALAVVLTLVPGIRSMLVHTNTSKIQGSFLQKGRIAFLGIPYAKPPLGKLRFAKPQPAPDADYFANDFKPGCLQYSEKPYPPWYSPRDPPPLNASDREKKIYGRYNLIKKDPLQSEDCLYLNIFAPNDAVNANNVDKSNRPTRVYVHGGGWFETGSARMPYYEGFAEAGADIYDDDQKLIQMNGILVITVQYRLGALGFLTSGTDDAPGNLGLFDIALALDWVHKNIEFFGGDVNQVTVEGQGAGAIAVSLLQTIPGMIPDRFKVALHSGSLLTLKALPGVNDKGDAFDNNLRLTDLLAKQVGCETSVRDKPKDTIKCLRGVNATLLVDTMASLSRSGPPDVFLPQIRGGLFPRDPYEALARDSLARDGFASFVSDEGSHLLTSAFPKVFGALGENDVPLSAGCARKAARKILQKFPAGVVDSLLRNLDEEASVCNRKKVVRAIGDAYVYCPTVYYAEHMKRGGNSTTKFYLLEKQVYPAAYNPWSEWMGSVHFSNVQTDFLGYEDMYYIDATGEYSVAWKSDQQMKQALNNHKLIKALTSSQELPISEFTADTPAYNLINSNGTLCVGKTYYHRRNCDILRPYFEYKD